MSEESAEPSEGNEEEAAKAPPASADPASQKKKKGPTFYIAIGIALLLMLTGTAGQIVGIAIICAALGAPLFALLGIVTFACFILDLGKTSPQDLSSMVERMRGLIDQKELVAIPLFIASGAIMSRGQISTRLVEFSRACVGWIPGGLGMSAVFACAFFAAISGSSPATVIAIGGMMAPSLIEAGYSERFSHGLLSSAGSLGILIPPSIPMILFPIVYQGSNIEVELLFASGFGPGLVLALLMMGGCMIYGLQRGTPRDELSFSHIVASFRRGFWALMFPVLILGGIYGGIYNAVEAAAVSVVYAVFVELFIHRALSFKDIVESFRETGVLLGSLLVIIVAALAFNEYLTVKGVPQMLSAWIGEQSLTKWQFLLLLNGMLLLVGMAMDIVSAMLIFVPLLAPVAVSVGVNPLHFAIIFIVNLEIGYLTPPVGLNLFVASTLWEKPLGHIIRSVVPFIGLMVIGLGLVTYWPGLSIGVGHWLMGREIEEVDTSEINMPGALDDDYGSEELGGDDDIGEDGTTDGVQTLEEMMREAEGDPGEGSVQTLEEMMREADEGAQGSENAESPDESSMRVLSLEEMMREAGVQ